MRDGLRSRADCHRRLLFRNRRGEVRKELELDGQPRRCLPSGGRFIHGASVMAFVHPLARGAKVWTAKNPDDSEQPILVIVTTLPLDASQKGYKKSLIERLSRAAREHLAESKEAGSFVLINRLRDWKRAAT